MTNLRRYFPCRVCGASFLTRPLRLRHTMSQHTDPFADIPTAAELREKSRDRIAELERELATEKARADHNFKNAQEYASEIQTLKFQRRVFETAAQEAFSQRDDLLSALLAWKELRDSEDGDGRDAVEWIARVEAKMTAAILKAQGEKS